MTPEEKAEFEELKDLVGAITEIIEGQRVVMIQMLSSLQHAVDSDEFDIILKNLQAGEFGEDETMIVPFLELDEDGNIIEVEIKQESGEKLH